MGPRGRHWSGASVIPLLVEQRQDDPQSLLESHLAKLVNIRPKKDPVSKEVMAFTRLAAEVML